MANTPFQFPPPPPPPPRRQTHAEPALYQSNYPYSQSGKGRGRGSGFGQNSGGLNRPYGQGRANHRSDYARGWYGRSGPGNAGVYGGNHGSQQHQSNAAPYGQTDSSLSTRDQHYTSDWNDATRGGTTQSHGFHHNGPNGTHFTSLYRPLPLNRQPQNAYSSPFSLGSPQPARKRAYSATFTKPASTGPRPQAAPAVPSFNDGISLSLPTKAADLRPTPTKKPRIHNQLGLTPASQNHESSSDDENDEAKLASKLLNNADLVQFEYNGRTATLRTAADIALWIAERKKNYPTQAKAEAAKKEAAEKKRKWAEAKREREEALQAKRLGHEKVRQEELRLKALESKKRKEAEKEQKNTKKDRDNEDEEDEDHEIRAKRAKIKAEKLRLKANKAELKVLEAEAALRKARKRRASLQSSLSTENEPRMQAMSNGDMQSAVGLERTGAGHVAEADICENGAKHKTYPDTEETKNEAGILSAIKVEKDDKEQRSDSLSHSRSLSLSISDSSVLSDAEPTSSSASSSSPSESSNSGSDTAPEQTTSKQLLPTRVPPLRRPLAHANHLCRSLLATGRCPRGDQCRYSHDLPETLPGLEERKDKLKEKRKIKLGKEKSAEGPGKKERRKGLYQVMVEKEQEEERKQVLKAIIFMGERGMLGEYEKRDKAVDSTV